MKENFEQTKTKKSKTTVIISIIAMTIVAIIAIVGIGAYLTDTESVSNVFTVGKVDITLDEGVWDASKATNITANMKIAKQPKVTNIGANEAYVYLKVKVPKVNLKGDDETTSPLFTYTVNEGWTELESKKNDQTDYIEKVYYYNQNDGKLAVNGVTPTLFDEVKVANITSDTTYAGEKRLADAIEQNIEINAYAIQTNDLPKGRTTVQTAYDVILGNEDDATLIEQGIKVGDYVNYDATSGAGTGLSYTVDTSKSGSTGEAETFTSSDVTKWRVLSIKDGQIKLMADEPTNQEVTLNGKDGYKNAETILDEIGAIYGKGKGAESGRSIKIEDIEEHTTFDETLHAGYTKEFTSGTFIMEDGTEKVADSDNKITMTNTYYSYNANDYKKDEISYNMIFNKRSWIASRCIWVYEGVGYCGFDVRTLDSFGPDSLNWFGVCGHTLVESNDSSGSGLYNTLSVVPIVTLKSGIRGEQQEDGSWNLDV